MTHLAQATLLHAILPMHAVNEGQGQQIIGRNRGGRNLSSNGHADFPTVIPRIDSA
jgi:hypothetical protein